MTEAYDGRQVVGMDLHRRRSVLVRMTMDGRKLETARIENCAAALRAEIAKAGENPLVVLEATYGWYWAADVLRAAGAEVHLAHPLGVRAFSCRRVKNDERDCAGLADLARLGRLPGAWIAPPEVRALREIVRYRHKLAGQRTSRKDQVHAVLARCGIPVTHPDISGRGGGIWLDQLVLPAPYAGKVASLRALGAVICAEIGDITRFRTPGQLSSRAGLTPRHYESGTKVIRGHVSEQGSRMLRWALTEAIRHQPAGTRPRQVKDAITARRGPQARNIAKTAAARILLTQVFCAMRDGHVRRAARAPGRTTVCPPPVPAAGAARTRL
jgi:transposase